MDIVLSLCITTRNRLTPLSRLIEELAGQMTDAIELVIVDGASIDGTQEYLESVSKRCPKIRCKLETTNSGIDRGYDECVGLASGRYCWLLSDDDQIIQGGINSVLQVMLLGDFDLIVANSQVWDVSLTKCLIKKQIRIKNNIIYQGGDIDSLFSETAAVASFIGSIIVKREMWLKRERKLYYDSWFIHLGVIFQRQLDCGAIVMADPVIRIKYGAASWSDKSFDIWMKSWPKLLWSFSTVSLEVRNSVVPKEPGRSILKHLIFRCHHVTFLKASETIPHLSWFRLYIIRIIYLTPPKLCNMLVALGCYITKEKRLLLLYDMANSKSSGLLSRFLFSKAISPQRQEQ